MAFTKIEQGAVAPGAIAESDLAINVYTTSEVDSALALKADQSSIPTDISQLADNTGLFDGKADLTGASFTGQVNALNNLYVNTSDQVPNQTLSKSYIMAGADGTSTSIKTFPQALSLVNGINAATPGYGVGLRFQFSTLSDGIGKYAAIAGIAEGAYANKTALVFYTTPFANGGVDNVIEQMRISGDGYITKPRNPAFKVYDSTGTAWANQTVIGNTKVFDKSNSYSKTTGLFTAPVAGVYLFKADWRANSTSASWMDIRTSNGYIARHEETAGTVNQYHQSLVLIAELQAGDTAYVYAGANVRWDAGAIDGFAGYLIG